MVAVRRYLRYGLSYRDVEEPLAERSIDVFVPARRDAKAARRLFTRALRTLKVVPSEVVTDAAPVYPAVLEELVPSAWHHVEQDAIIRSRPITGSSSAG
jgi:transposase-like protein